MKFLVDSMLGKLTRFLRMFGYDTVYANDLIDVLRLDPVPDEKLVDYAKKNDRYIITKDYLLYKGFRENSLHLKGEGTYNYLNQLQKKLGLEFNFKIEYARCSKCNSKLKKIKDKNSVKELVLEETFRHYDDFFQCVNISCKKIYWKGSHVKDIVKRLEKNLL
ncbi:MAG: DUF5615 family PIN-like protein [Promethearchaeota archaeon]|jgi:uncharacterized protein with PIN domain